jgi:hypothetical protein
MTTPTPHFIEQLADDFIKDVRERPTDNSFLALARSANATSYEDLSAVETVNVLPAVFAEMGRDSCEFIDGLYFYLHKAECPSAAREFVSIICGISGGNSESFISVSDPEIANRMGVSLSTVGYRRRTLVKWMKKANFNCVEIVEGDWNQKAGKNETTKYRIIITPLIVELVNRARAKVLYEKSRKNALRESAAELHTRALAEAADEAMDETPLAPLVKERKKKEKTNDEKVKSARKTILTLFNKCGMLERKEGRWATDFLRQLALELKESAEEIDQKMEFEVRAY